MATKLEIKGNFLFITEGSDLPERFISRITSYDFNSTQTELLIRQPQGSNQVTFKYNVNDLVDSEDSSFGTIEDIETFLNENLGFSGAGGSAAKKTGKHLIGWQDFADSNTSESNPIEQTLVNGGEVQLTNNNNDTLTDGNTSVNAETTVVGLNDLWDTTTNTFVFDGTGIEKNDLLSFRVHLNLSATIISQDFTLRFDFFDAPGGTGSQLFSLRQHLATETLSAGVFRERIVTVDAFVGESVLNGSAKIFLEGTKSFEVEVIGWNIRIFKIAR